jgi:hypothetical protein
MTQAATTKAKRPGRAPVASPLPIVPAKSTNHGYVTIKILRRTHDLLAVIINHEALTAMEATVGVGESCDECHLAEYRKRIPMTEIVHQALCNYAKAKGVSTK